MLTTISQVLIGICICLLILLCVAGNSLVCLAIYKDSRLRRTENLFLASLAVSDLLVAVLVMTFAGFNDVLGYWMFGQRLCNVWICVDIMCSTASILNLCAISLERYLHIKDPFRYSVLVTKKAIFTSIAIIWTISALISILPVSMGMHSSSVSVDPSSTSTCIMDLSPLYAIISSSLSFCLPCLVMVSIYIRLYLTSRRHYNTITQLCQCHPPSKDDHKAPLTIGVLMGIFLVCWLPFFCANILVAFCKLCVSPSTFKIFTWLGYSNSLFNPIVYTALNCEFRDSFKLLLLRNWSLQGRDKSVQTRPLNLSSSSRSILENRADSAMLECRLSSVDSY